MERERSTREIQDDKLAQMAPRVDAVQKKIEHRLGRTFSSPFFEEIHNGMILCELSNLVVPGAIPKISPDKKPHKEKENISKFIGTCRKNFRLSPRDIFSPTDLHEEKNLVKVITTLERFLDATSDVAATPQVQEPPKSGSTSVSKPRQLRTTINTKTNSKPSITVLVNRQQKTLTVENADDISKAVNDFVKLHNISKTQIPIFEDQLRKQQQNSSQDSAAKPGTKRFTVAVKRTTTSSPGAQSNQTAGGIGRRQYNTSMARGGGYNIGDVVSNPFEVIQRNRKNAEEAEIRARELKQRKEAAEEQAKKAEEKAQNVLKEKNEFMQALKEREKAAEQKLYDIQNQRSSLDKKQTMDMKKAEADAKAQLIAIRNQLNESNQQVGQLQNQLLQEQQRVKLEERARKDAETELRRKQRELQEATRKIEANKNNMATFDEERAKFDEERKKMEEELCRKEAELRNAQLKIDSHDGRLEGLKREVTSSSKATLDEERAKFDEERKKIEEELRLKEDELRNAKLKIESHDGRLEDLKREANNTTLDEERAKFDEERKKMEQELRRKEDELRNAQLTIDSHDGSLEGLKREIDEQKIRTEEAKDQAEARMREAEAQAEERIRIAEARMREAGKAIHSTVSHRLSGSIDDSNLQDTRDVIATIYHKLVSTGQNVSVHLHEGESPSEALRLLETRHTLTAEEKLKLSNRLKNVVAEFDEIRASQAGVEKEPLKDGLNGSDGDRASDMEYTEKERMELMIEMLKNQLKDSGIEAVTKVSTLKEAKEKFTFYYQKLEEEREKGVDEKQLVDTEAELVAWSQVIENHPETLAVKEQELQTWKTTNIEPNLEALRVMKTFVPQDIRLINQQELENRGLTKALAKRIFTKKCLHMCRRHKRNIAKLHSANLPPLFGLDIIELRAVYASLPDTFENDGDGKKAEYREKLFDNLRNMANEEEKGRLRSNQIRNSVYKDVMYGPFEPDEEIIFEASSAGEKSGAKDDWLDSKIKKESKPVEPKPQAPRAPGGNLGLFAALNKKRVE